MNIKAIRTRIIPYKEVLERLRAGEKIHWTGGINPSTSFNHKETIRYDTVAKLWKQGLVTDYGYPLLHGTIEYKGDNK